MWKQKLTSRKFWVAVVSAVLIVLNEGMGLDIPADTVKAFMEIVIAYLIAEGAVDTARALKGTATKS
jgi:uncharacterized membrane protein